MDWTGALDGYCERIDPSYWAEPINAVSNFAFLAAAIIMWHRTDGFRPAQWLAALLFAIGVGSFLFHTHATLWSAMLDVIPIILFSFSYIYLANRDFWGFSVRASVLGTLGFLPFAYLAGGVFSALPFFQISASYWSLPLLIGVYGVFLWKRFPILGRNLCFGATLLCVSLTARSLDEILCVKFPFGTHFLWHLLNALMLGWMIEVWRRHKTQAA